MITPQQIEQVSFDRATFGGYDMQSVDEFLEPLTEDYITLFKENALLKSKMRILVSKLEEYRNNEESMKDAIVNAQKTCDLMVKEAEVKCTQMLTDANALAMENAKNADALIQAEQERVEEARRVAAAKIDALSEQLAACLQALADIKSANAPVKSAANADSPATMDDATAAVADEISSNLEAMIGTTEDIVLTADPQRPTTDTATTKFPELKFGRNYPST